MKAIAITETRDGKVHLHTGYSGATSARGKEAAEKSAAGIWKYCANQFASCCQSTNSFALNWRRNHRLIALVITAADRPVSGLVTLRHGTVVVE